MGNIAVHSHGEQAAAAADRLAAAHRALKADGTIQFALERAPPPPEPPRWLTAFLESLKEAMRPVGRVLSWISSFMPDAPYARIFLWTVLILAALFVAATVYRGLRHAEWRLWRRKKRPAVPVEAEEEWTLEAAPARAWLREADSLADEGRYAEAIRHLLFRSVEDISRRRPRLVRPALTSRELAAAPALPERARSLFSRIALLVEESLFGGRPVGPDQWAGARASYADFALPASWRE